MKRVVFFDPFYIFNICQNECAYCRFQKSNKETTRKRLTKEDLKNEIEFLINQGVK
jgi:2-iminoacetate synthase